MSSPGSCFNPRTHTGCDDKDRPVKHPGGKFQSTHPHGVRPIPAPCPLFSCCFNPRTHTGCDREAARYLRRTKVSIHAPTRGATYSRYAYPAKDLRCFNPRTHTGCDIADDMEKCAQRCFNPRTHTGCDGSIT